jgi:glycerophosphoryl diester phosphodiesterase
MNQWLEWIRSGKIMMAAHRGDRDCRPENTLPAFLHAVELGADGIETDLHQTHDGEIVMMHDLRIDRTTDGQGRVCDMTLAELRTFDAGVKFGEEYRGTKIPTFSEFLDVVEPHSSLLLNLEIKDYPEELGDFAYRTADKIVAMVEERGIGDRVMFNSFSWRMLKYLHETYPAYPLHGFYPEFLMKDPEENVYRYLTYVCLFRRRKLADGTVDKEWGRLDPLCSEEEFRTVKETLGCEPCVCFHTDTPELMRDAIARGVTMFTCNNPERAIAILKELGARD